MTESYLLRLLLAVCLGSIIGLEREYRAKGAGARTHSLVSLGSALFMVLSYAGFDFVLAQTPNVSLDPSRIASQVVTGIGFIGGGIRLPVFGLHRPSVWPAAQGSILSLSLSR